MFASPAASSVARPSARRLARITLTLVGLGAFAGASAVAATPSSSPAGAAHRAGGGTVLTCDARTVKSDPITFSPAITQASRDVEVRGELKLTDCSGKGEARALRSGRLSGSGVVRASCDSARALSGTATITWYDADGRRAGTSTIRPAKAQTKDKSKNKGKGNDKGRAKGDRYSPGDSLFSGKVTDGPLAGTTVAVSTTRAGDAPRCADNGLRTLQGSGTAVFRD